MAVPIKVFIITAVVFILRYINCISFPKEYYSDINNISVRIVSTSECGLSGPEEFCQLAGSTQVADCGICNARNESQRHPIAYAVDSEDGTFWKSANFEHQVNITISYGLEVIVKDIRLTMGPSPRPRIWVLEKSIDYGKTFSAWRYFADNHENCLSYADKQPRAVPEFTTDEVICTTKFSDYHPLKFGEIFILPETVKRRNKRKQLFIATNIRLRFEELHTLRGDVVHNISSFTQRVFYSLTNIHINSDCNCNGYECHRNETLKIHECQCKNNVCGKSCEECCPGFHKIFPNTNEVPFFCEEISPTTKTPTTKASCGCDPTGSRSDDCSFDGKCECYSGFSGTKCNRCKDMYWDFPECKRCDCDSEGTLSCNPFTGDCNCKRNYEGDQCNRCTSGTTKSPFGCIDCNCDEDGSESSTCDVNTGKCTCRENYEGLKCNKCAQNAIRSVEGCIAETLPVPVPTRIVVPVINFTYIPPRNQDCNCSTIGSVSPICDAVTGKCRCKVGYSGLKCDSLCPKPNRTCSLCDCNPEGSLESICRKNGRCLCKPNIEGLTCNRCLFDHWGFPNCKPCNCNKDLSLSKTCNLTTGQCICKDNVIGLQCEQCQQDFFLKGQQCIECFCNKIGTKDGKCSFNGECICKPEITGKLCNRCNKNYWGFPNCKSCNCHTLGSWSRQCHNVTGKCLCKENVIGNLCDSCATPRGILMRTGCIECDVCTDVLLNELPALEVGVADQLLEMKDCNTSELGETRKAYLKSMSQDLYKEAMLLGDKRRVLDPKIARLQEPENIILFLEDEIRILEMKSIWLEVNISRTALNITKLQKDLDKEKLLASEVQKQVTESILQAWNLKNSRSRNLKHGETTILIEILNDIKARNFSRQRASVTTERRKLDELLRKAKRYPTFLLRLIVAQLTKLNDYSGSIRNMSSMVTPVIPQIRKRLIYVNNIRLHLDNSMHVLDHPKKQIKVAQDSHLNQARKLKKLYEDLEKKKRRIKTRTWNLKNSDTEKLVRDGEKHASKLEANANKNERTLAELLANRRVQKILHLMKDYNPEDIKEKTKDLLTDINGTFEKLDSALFAKKIRPSGVIDSTPDDSFPTDDSDYFTTGFPSGDDEVPDEIESTSTRSSLFSGWFGDQPIRRKINITNYSLINQVQQLRFESIQSLKKGVNLQAFIKDVRKRLHVVGDTFDVVSKVSQGHVNNLTEFLLESVPLIRNEMKTNYTWSMNYCGMTLKKCELLDLQINDILPNIRRQRSGIKTIEKNQKITEYQLRHLKDEVDNSVEKVFQAKRISKMTLNGLNFKIKREISMLQQKIQKVKQLASKFKIAVNMSSPGFIGFNFREESSIPSYSMNLQVSFMTDYKNGTLLSTAPSDDKLRLYFGLKLSKGHLTVGFRNWSKSLSLTSRLATRVWYRLYIQRIGSRLNVKILEGDDEIDSGSVDLVTPPFIAFSLPLFIGGYPDEYKELPIGKGYFSKDGDFDGAVDDLFIDYHHISLGTPDFSRGNQEPRLHGSLIGKTLASLNPNGFIKMSLPEELTAKYLNLKLSFKTRQKSGLLIHLQGSTKARFLSIWLYNGVVHYMYYDNNENATMATRRQTYNDGLWHEIQLLQNENKLHLILDGSDKKGTTILYWDVGYKFRTALYGGLDKTTKEMIPHKYRIYYKNFFGCIQNVIINKAPQEFQENDGYKNAVIGSCIQPTSACACRRESPLSLAISLESIAFVFKLVSEAPFVGNILSYQTSAHHYIRIFHQDNSVVVEVKDRNKSTMQYNTAIMSDGKWHAVSLRFHDHRCSFTVDNFSRSFKCSVHKDGFHPKLDLGPESNRTEICLGNVIINERFFDLSEVATDWITCRSQV